MKRDMKICTVKKMESKGKLDSRVVLVSHTHLGFFLHTSHGFVKPVNILVPKN